MKISIPAIRYKQGDRVMYVSAAPAADLVKLTSTPRDWNPLAPQTHGNRPVDKSHVQGIVNYLELEEHPVIGAFVLYCDAEEVIFESPSDPDLDGITIGTVSMSPSVLYDIGDGRHRRDAEAAVIERHAQDPDNEIYRRVMRMGQPFVLIPESDGRRRAQDYADLQVNVKAPTGSLGMSMDRRQPFNRFMIEDVVISDEVPLFDGGDRIEFLKDSPGKNSSKWASFKTVRYMAGTVLIGVAHRSTKKWNGAVDEVVGDGGGSESLAHLVEFFNGVAELKPLDQAVSGESSMADVRQGSLLTSANVMYALAYASHLAYTKLGRSPKETLSELRANVDFSRPTRVPSEDKPLTGDEPGGFFAGSLIDPVSGKVGSGRPAWERAGRKLFQTAAGDNEYQTHFPQGEEGDQ